MAEVDNSQPVKKKGLFSFGSRKKVGKSVEDCPIQKVKNHQLVVGVAGSGTTYDGVTVKVVDAAGKKSSKKSSGGGLTAFAKLAAGDCSITLELPKSLAGTHVPPARVTQRVAIGSSVTVNLKLQPMNLALTPTLACGAPIGLFEPVANRGEAIPLSLQVAGEDEALAIASVTLRRTAGISLFKDRACLQPFPFTNNAADIPPASFTGGTAFQLWARGASKAGGTLTLSAVLHPDKMPKDKKSRPLGTSATVSSMPLALSWRDAAPITLAIAGDSRVSSGTSFSLDVTVNDADQIAVSGQISIADKAGTPVRTFDATTDLGNSAITQWDESWDGKDDGNTLVALDRGPFTVRFEVTDRFTGKVNDRSHQLTIDPPLSFFTLQLKDPDGAVRALPAGLELEAVHADGTVVTGLKLAAGGKLLGADGNEGVVLHPQHGAATLRFLGTDKYVLCEPPGQALAEAQLKTAEQVKTIVETLDDPALAGSRAFLLPKDPWDLETSVWSASDDGGRFAPATGLISASQLPVGTSATPAKLVLDCRWQYARFTYADRARTGPEQVSSLPLFLDGYGARPAATTDKPITRSNWTTGDTLDKTVQCLPWIVRAKVATEIVPSKSSELRFTTAAQTFIETPLETDQPRKWAVGTERNAPSAARLRFYDLPAEWRSHNWYVRKQANGRDGTGEFFFQLDTPAKVLATKDAPLIFSLDDMVLYERPDPAQPAIRPLAALTDAQPVAVFHHSFAAGTDVDLSPEGIFLVPATPAKGTLPKIEDVRWPASAASVLQLPNPPTVPILENYVKRYPDWTRLLAAEGSLFDVFDQRTAADTSAPGRVVGARAAVRIVDITAPIDNVKIGNAPAANAQAQPGRQIIPRPLAVRTPFLTVQQLAETTAPVGNLRLDFSTCATKGTGSTDASDFGARYARAPSTFDEPTAHIDADQLRTVGRSDNVLVRCCGLEGNGTVEKAMQIGFLRLSTEFGTNSAANTEDLRANWIKTAMTGLFKRWNGPDGIYNAGRVRIEPRDLATRTTDKISIESIRLFQHLPDALGGMRFKVIGRVSGSRDYMNSSLGETQSQDGNEKAETAVETLGRFTAAHEMGHGAGLLDDYCEVSNHASYYQPGVPMLVQGDPYVFDDTDGSESMMKGNRIVRERHHWQMAEWTRAMLPTEMDLQILRPGGTPFFLPHHPANRASDPVAIRSFLTFPWKASLDIRTGGTGAGSTHPRCDAYAYALGNDVYSRDVLPLRTGDAGNQPFDGIVVFTVAMCLNFDGLIDHYLIRNACSSLVTTLRSTFSQRVAASLTINGREFKQALVVISPRIIVGTHAGDERYDLGLKLDKHGRARAWAASTQYQVGSRVKPTPENGFVYVGAAVNDDSVSAPPQLSGSAQPAWPTRKGGKVWDNKIQWEAIPAAEARKPDYLRLITSKLAQNPIHLTVEMTAALSELAFPPTAMPRVRLAAQQLHVFEETTKLAYKVVIAQRGARTALENTRQREQTRFSQQQIVRNRAISQITALGLQRDTASREVIVAQGQHTTATTEEDRNLALTSWNNAYSTYQARLLDITNQERARDAAQLEMNDAQAKERTAIRLCDALRGSHVIPTVLAQAQAMAEAIFTSDTDPLNDAGYTELIGQLATLATAAGRTGATRDTVIAAITSTRAPAVAARAARHLLSADAKPVDIAAAGACLRAICVQIHDWAAQGTDDPDKKRRAAQASGLVARMQQTAVTKATARYDAQIIKVDGGWSALDYNLPNSVMQASLACASGVALDLENFYTKESPATLEEQVKARFVDWLGLSEDPRSTDGFGTLLAALADSGTTPSMWVIRPPPAPPPPLMPPTTGPTGEVVALPRPTLLEQITAAKEQLTAPPPPPPPPPPPN